MTPSRFRMFLLWKLPLAFMAGVRLENLSTEQAVTSIRFGWLNQNPFRSIYFGALAMTAEICTGILVMTKIQEAGSSVSMLVTEMKAEFTKKAVGKILFTCDQGIEVEELISQALADGEGHTLILKTVGTDEKNEVVATFYFTWSIKQRTLK